MKNNITIFPLRLTSDMHKLITLASFAVGKSKSDYCRNAIIKMALVDAKKIKIVDSRE